VVTSPSAFDVLTDAFTATLDEALGADAAVVVTSWPTVPVEVIRAAGAVPFVVRGSSDAAPHADRRLEPDIFPSRLRHLADAALDGRLSRAAAVVLPRSSDPDYKAFLYLREYARTESFHLPPTRLFDVLQSDGPDVASYDRSRVQALADDLATLTGRTVTHADLHREIERANRARAAARDLLALRAGPVRVSGTEVLPLIGTLWRMDPDRYTALAGETAAHLRQRIPLGGPRILLAGAPVDSPNLHAAIEAAGAVVVAEASPWGTGAPGADVREDDDPVAALADAYRASAIGARAPRHHHRAWLDRALTDVDGVVVWLPADDTVFGWDYPALRDHLDTRRLPHVAIEDDEHAPVSAATREQLEHFVRRAAARGGSVRG
jgi:benzoyl-CoA reductase/2-hydroxyglutaryl-CoA dehydratase subunit BcrC/BadD/HgdB